MQDKKTYSELDKHQRKEYIDGAILAHLPESERPHELTRVMAIANAYDRCAGYALGILASSARAKRYHEVAEKLQKHYTNRAQFDKSHSSRKDGLDKFIETLVNGKCPSA